MKSATFKVPLLLKHSRCSASMNVVFFILILKCCALLPKNGMVARGVNTIATALFREEKPLKNFTNHTNSNWNLERTPRGRVLTGQGLETFETNASRETRKTAMTCFIVHTSRISVRNNKGDEYDIFMFVIVGHSRHPVLRAYSMDQAIWEC